MAVIEQAYQAIWDSFCGRPAHSNLVFPLRDQQSYDDLYEKLQVEEPSTPELLAHFQEAVRRDWVAGVLTLRRMVPTPLHDQFQEEVKLAICKELDRIAKEQPVLRPFRHKIRLVGQAQVQKRTPSRAPAFEVSPDGQYRYEGSRTPPFILEVACSRDADDLRHKITQIFIELEGKVSAVLAFDIGYEDKAQRKQGHSHAASVSLWTSERIEDTINVAMDTQVFRTDDGRFVPGELVLPFKSFLPLPEQAKLPQHDEKVRLEFALLAGLVQAAEQTQGVQDASVSPSPPLPAESRRPAKRIRFIDLNTDTTRELQLPASKRPRSSSGSAISPSARTRSASRPRRSSRLRSLSQEQTPQ